MSKGLEALEELKNNDFYDEELCMYVEDSIGFENIEKELNALEIIKKKRIDMWHLMDMLEQDYVMYCAWCVGENYSDEFVLTQEEFELLKEVLNDE